MTWETGSIMIRGEEVPVKTGMMEHLDLSYFVDNPRIYSVVRADDTIPDQDEIQNRLWKMEHVKELRIDIQENGGLIDPIIVKDGTLEVLEGNSRLAAYRKLAEQDAIRWGEIKCTLLPADIQESHVFSLLGQYHIKGKKDWSPYEQAGFLYRRHKQHNIGVTELGKDLGIGRKEAGKLIRAYQLMLDSGDSDTTRWSYYYEYLSSTNIGKLREEYSGFHETVVAKIKSGEIERAADIRDKLAKIPVKSKKVVNAFIAGEISVDDAYNRVEASGSTDVTYNRINKFRIWFGSEETLSSLKKVTPETRQKIELELKKLARDTKRLQGVIQK